MYWHRYIKQSFQYSWIYFEWATIWFPYVKFEIMNKIIRYFKFQWSLIKGYSLETRLKIKKISNECQNNKTHVEISFWRALYRTTISNHRWISNLQFDAHRLYYPFRNFHYVHVSKITAHWARRYVYYQCNRCTLEAILNVFQCTYTGGQMID